MVRMKTTRLLEYLSDYLWQGRRGEKLQENISNEDVPGSQCAIIKDGIKPIL